MQSVAVFSTSASAISIFAENNETNFRHFQSQLAQTCSSFTSIDKCLVEKTYNQSELLEDVLLGFEKKKSLTKPINLITEELTKPAYGRYYTLRPSFLMTTDDRTNELLLELKRNLSTYYIHVFDPRFYLGFSNPSIPMVSKKIKPDETLGIYYSLVVTEVSVT